MSQVLPIDLWGAFHDNYSYAKEVAFLLESQPLYKMFITFDPKTKTGANAFYVDYKNNVEQRFNLCKPGIYAIYSNQKINLDCLYVGESSYRVQDRTRRFGLGITARLRDDENHPGGERAWISGYDHEHLFIRFLPKKDYPTFEDVRLDPKIELDETVAILLRSLFNKKVGY